MTDIIDEKTLGETGKMLLVDPIDDSKEPVWKTLLHDILKENGYYSIGRVLLLVSFLICCIFWVILRTDAPSTAVASMTLFAGYIFGGKSIDAVKSMKGGNEQIDGL